MSALEIDVLRAEQDRLYVLLTDALQLACAGRSFDAGTLLEVLAARRGFNLARAHYYEERDRKRKTAELVRVLRATEHHLAGTGRSRRDRGRELDFPCCVNVVDGRRRSPRRA